MILVDANLLIYAYDLSSPFHTPARRWLEQVLSATEPVALAWVTVLAFLRITTHARAFTSPFSLAEAEALVDSWFAQPNVSILHPGENHWPILQSLLGQANAQGPLIMDGHLAALAVEHEATLCSSDRDFSRFEGLSWVNPLAAAVSPVEEADEASS